MDEAGGGEPLRAAEPNSTPALIMLGVVIDQACLAALTPDFIQAKRRFFPGLFRNDGFLESVLREIKGNELRNKLRTGSSREKGAALGFLHETIRLLEACGAALIGRVWIKEPEKRLREKAIYGFSVQDICRHFHHLLVATDDAGLLILDSRTKSQNTPVAHTVFTRKFKSNGDEFPRIIEMPTFGHSDNHVGVQIADLVSGVVFAMATRTFCGGLTGNVHCHPAYDALKQQFGQRIRQLQYRYTDHKGDRRGGLVVNDRLGHQPGSRLFVP
jgi:uncharacterized protein DUF3800